VGVWSSNYARDKIGVWNSNYTDLQVLYTSNYVARINTSINTGKQDIINSIANQIIIGNGNGLTTTSTGLTFATNTLNATNLSISGITTLTGNVGIGTTASTPLHVYNATSSLLRLQTGTSGKPSIEFSVGTLTDTITDYRIINDAYELKFQYQDNLVSYGGVGSDIMVINDKGTTYTKPAYYESGLGVKTSPDPLYSLDVSGNCRYLSGNIGIGIEPLSPYRLNVGGDINIEGIGKRYFVNNTPIVSSQWATSGTTIEYNTGSVGIGTSPFSYKLNVNGSINATSVLVGGNPVSGSKWTTATDTTRIYYNTGNVGIGTTNPQTELHINDATTGTTALTIQNNFTGGGAITSSPSATTTGTTGIYTYQIFTYTTGATDTSYTITIPTGGLVCDVLIVGGGGGGDRQIGGGGGGGAVLYATNITIPANNYTIKVGKGGAPNVNGSPSEAFGATCLGGGSTLFVAWNVPNGGRAGGSGSGGSSGDTGGTYSGGGVGVSTKGTLLSSGTLYNGNIGGNGCQLSGSGSRPGGGGGGGGAITAGKNAVQVEYSTRQAWLNAGSPGVGGNGVPINITGTEYYWGAGGGGGQHVGYGADGGLGGGGGGSSQTSLAITSLGGTGGISAGGDVINNANGGNGGANTGSGGGGSTFPGNIGSTGGSGIIIIRYLTPSSSSTIELIRGTTTDANHDWKIGNYNGEFKVISSVSSVDTDRLVVSSAGNVGIGTTNPSNILQVGSGGRLRIANNTADQTIIGGDDVASATSSRIELKGSTFVNFSTSDNGNIWYYARGFHLFYVSNVEMMRIVTTGVYFSSTTNFVGNNGRTQLFGRVGIGKAEDTTLILDVLGNSRMTGNLSVSSFILTNDAVYARNSYDTRIYSDGGGMYLGMGDIGNVNYMRVGAYNGVGNVESGANRNLHLIVQNGAMGSATRQLFQFRSSGECMNALNSTSWNQVSDQRVKENIKKANLNICFDNVKNINLYRYNYIKGFRDTIPDKTQLGFVAQQVQQHFPKSVGRSKIRIEDKRELPDLASVSIDQINFTLFGAVKQLIRVVEKQSKRIKKLEDMLGIVDNDDVENDADEPYERIVCDEVDIDTIEPSEPTEV
jgi:hypothetical protein